MASEEKDRNELVYIKHPNVKKLGGPVPRRTLPTWERRGWSEVEPAAAVAAQATGDPNADLDKMKREELEEVARAAGVDPSSAKTNAELAEMIRKAAAPAT